MIRIYRKKIITGMAMSSAIEPYLAEPLHLFLLHWLNWPRLVMVWKSELLGVLHSRRTNGFGNATFFWNWNNRRKFQLILDFNFKQENKHLYLQPILNFNFTQTSFFPHFAVAFFGTNSGSNLSSQYPSTRLSQV